MAIRTDWKIYSIEHILCPMANSKCIKICGFIILEQKPHSLEFLKKLNILTWNSLSAVPQLLWDKEMEEETGCRKEKLLVFGWK